MSNNHRTNGSNRLLVFANVMLLLALGWTVVGQRPASHAALAAAEGSTDDNVGIPNAAGQRQKMIEELRLLRQSVDAVNKSINSGNLKMEITNLDKMKSDSGKPTKEAPRTPTRPAPADDGSGRRNPADDSPKSK